MDGLCPTSLEPLVTYFRRLVAEGRGDGARGRNFHALFVLEFAYRERLLAFHPSRRPSDWLAMLFDLVSDYQEAYLSHGTREEAVIRARLQQSWQAFLQELRSAGLSRVAQVTDVVIKRKIAATMALWLRPELLDEADKVDSLALCEVFDLLPPLKSATKDRSKHPLGSTLRKDLSRYFDPLWYGLVQKRRKKDLSLVDVFACLPPSGRQVLELVHTFFARKGEELCAAPFAAFYSLARDAKDSRKTELWEPADCYIGNDETREHVELISRFRAEVERENEVVRLGISATFPCTMQVIDAWLEHCERFPELHAGKAWCEAYSEHSNQIAQDEARLRAEVVSLAPAFISRRKQTRPSA